MWTYASEVKKQPISISLGYLGKGLLKWLSGIESVCQARDAG